MRTTARSLHRVHVTLAAFVLFVCTTTRVGAQDATAPEDLLTEALRVSAELDETTDIAAARCAFVALVDKIRPRLTPTIRSTPKAVVAVLSEHVLRERKATYLNNLYWRDSLFTSALLRNRGNCVATSLLYHLVARELGLPVRIATAPRHMYVRWEGERERFAIETTAGGAIVPDEMLLDLPALDASEGAYGRGLTDREARATLLRIWGDTFATVTRDDRAGELYRSARELWPGSRDILMAYAGFLARRGRPDEARAIALEVQNTSRGRHYRGLAEALLGRLDEDTRDFERALDRTHAALPQVGLAMVPTMLHRVGVLYRHQRNFEAAIAIHRLGVAMRPDQNGWSILASALTEAHRDVEAIAAYEEASRLNPEDFFSKVILAGLYERQGQRARGRALFDGIAEPKEQRLQWLGALVWYYAVTEQVEPLIANMRLALKEDQGNWMINYFLREPDLDPYIHLPEVRALWAEHLPAGAELQPELPPEPEREREPAVADVVAVEDPMAPSAPGSAPVAAQVTVAHSRLAWVLNAALGMCCCVLAVAWLQARRSANS